MRCTENTRASETISENARHNHRSIRRQFRKKPY